MICIVKRTEETKEPLIRKIKSCKEERCVEYEKICKNDVRELLYEQSVCNAACRERRCTCRNAEKEFLHSAECISQILLGPGVEKTETIDKIEYRRIERR